MCVCISGVDDEDTKNQLDNGSRLIHLTLGRENDVPKNIFVNDNFFVLLRYQRERFKTNAIIIADY